jgi:hypothetical protein
MSKQKAKRSGVGSASTAPAISEEQADLKCLEQVLDLIRDQLAATLTQWATLNSIYDGVATLIARQTGEVPAPRLRDAPTSAQEPLLDALAAAGRARRQRMEAQGTPPWELRKQDPAWQKRWDDLLARVRSELPPDLTPEEVEAEITRASEEVRNERLARGR